MKKRSTPSSSSRDPVKKRLSGVFRGRDSLASCSRPGSVSRLSMSTARRTANEGPLKDPRNLSNRAKQREMTDDILNFLQINGYPHQVSQKILQAPTSKDFVKLFEFLFGMLDKGEKIERKFEEEVPRLLKQIGYPFPIPKSAMFTIGSLHTWPTLLGALHWMVELIEYCQTLDPDQLLYCQNKDDPRYGCDKIIDAYLEKAYKDFLRGIDNSEEDDSRLTEAILVQTGASKENDEALQREIAELEQELAELEAEPDRLKEMQDKLAFNKAECARIEQHERDLINEEKALDIKQAKYRAELQKYEPEEIRQIQAAGSTEHEKEILTNRLAAVRAENEKLQTKCWEKEISFSKTYNRVDKLLSEYNDIVRNLTFDKTLMEYLEGKDISMKFDHKESSILDRNKFKDTIKDVLIQCHNKISSDIHRLEAERITEEDKLEKLTEMCAEKQREITLAQTRLENLNKEIEALQEKTGMVQKATEDELLSLREEIKSLESSSSTDLAKRERELAELKQRMETELVEMKEKSQKAADFLMKVVQKTNEHKAIIEAGIKKWKKDKMQQMGVENTSESWQEPLEK